MWTPYDFQSRPCLADLKSQQKFFKSLELKLGSRAVFGGADFKFLKSYNHNVG